MIWNRVTHEQEEDILTEDFRMAAPEVSLRGQALVCALGRAIRAVLYMK